MSERQAKIARRTGAFKAREMTRRSIHAARMPEPGRFPSEDTVQLTPVDRLCASWFGGNFERHRRRQIARRAYKSALGEHPRKAAIAAQIEKEQAEAEAAVRAGSRP